MERPEQPAGATEACFPNIGERGRQRRLRGGLVWLVTGMALTIWFIVHPMRALVFLPLWVVFFMAALGYFQAHEKT